MNPATLDFIYQADREGVHGLAPHYLTLYSIALGMEAKNVCEFGTGLSTRVLLDALKETGGHLLTCSTDNYETVCGKANIHLTEHVDRWTHWSGLSYAFVRALSDASRFDLVLHDGSHSEKTVFDDLVHIIPRVRRGGLVLVHDTLHSYSGLGMLRAVNQALAVFRLAVFRSDSQTNVAESVTLPFGFGLTMLQIKENWSVSEDVKVTRGKRGSLHFTNLEYLR